MKKIIFFVMMAILVVGCSEPMLEDSSSSANSNNSLELKKGDAKTGCVSIQDGKLFTSQGELIKPGYMENGYNYQAHIYNGDYGYGKNVHLVMKWNDAWLSNQDCNGDGLLDRPLKDGKQYYYGSGAWCTNHWTEVYTDENGKRCQYSEFIKIVAVPEGSYKKDGYFYSADGVQIGQIIWGQFAIVEYVVNDPCGGVHGIQYKSPDHPGLGNW